MQGGKGDGMTGRIQRLLLTPALAGLLAGVALAGMPGAASADTEGVALSVACRDGACDSNDPEGGISDGRTFSLHRSSGNTGEWEPSRGGPMQRLAPWRGTSQRMTPPETPPWRVSPKAAYKRGGYGPGGYQKVATEAACSADNSTGNVALLCDNDVRNDIWINVSQWGSGNQVNIAVFFQNITQYAAAGSGNAANTATNNEINANLTQANQDY